jgi:hypothetical protein
LAFLRDIFSGDGGGQGVVMAAATMSGAVATPSVDGGHSDRKERSSALLTQAILDRLPDTVAEGVCWELSVDDITTQLGCHKGSLLQIFHVLESLLLVTKVGRSVYRWHGVGGLRQTLAFMRLIADRLHIDQHIKAVRRQEVAAVAKEAKHKQNLFLGALFGIQMPSVADEDEGLEKSCDDLLAAAAMTGANSFHSAAALPDGTSRGEEDKLQLLSFCHLFIMILLVMSESETPVSLEFVSKVIHHYYVVALECDKTSFQRSVAGNGVARHLLRPDTNLQSRARRLGEIVNILAGLRPPLAQKVHVIQFTKMSRMAVRYVGPDIRDVFLSDEDLLKLQECPYRKRHLFFTVGMRLLGMPERPAFIPETLTIRLEEREDGQWSPVDESLAACTSAGKLTTKHQELGFIASGRTLRERSP